MNPGTKLWTWHINTPGGKDYCIPHDIGGQFAEHRFRDMIGVQANIDMNLLMPQNYKWLEEGEGYTFSRNSIQYTVISFADVKRVFLESVDSFLDRPDKDTVGCPF
jgi:hypothetical protein